MNKNGSLNLKKDIICIYEVGQLFCESDSELQILVGSQKQVSFVENETVFMCEIGNWMRRWYSGHSFVCSCDSAVRFSEAEK